MHEPLIYSDRRNTDCVKWDAMDKTFGDPDLIPLWVADMDFKSPACVRKALSDWAEYGLYGYYKIPEAYYQAFMAWERNRHGYTVERDWLRVSPGIVTATFWLTQVFTRPGDGVMLLMPVYYPFFMAIEKTGRRIVGSPLINQGGVYTIDFQDFERRIVEEKATAFILCSPHNPVGRVWTPEELKALGDICARHGVTIISDEIHHDLIVGERPHIPTGTLLDKVVTVTSASKTFNLAGLQNSFIILPDAAMREQFDAFVEKINVISGNMAGYIATRAAYEGGEPWLDSVLAQIRANYALLKAAADRIHGAVLSPLEGTYLAWLDLTACIPEGKAKEIVQDICRMAVDFGDWFGGQEHDRFIRVNLATGEENVRQACENLVARLGQPATIA